MWTVQISAARWVSAQVLQETGTRTEHTCFIHIHIHIMGLFFHSITDISSHWSRWIYVREEHFNGIGDTRMNVRTHINMQIGFTHVNVYKEYKCYIKSATRCNIYFNVHYLYEIGNVSFKPVYNQLLSIKIFYKAHGFYSSHLQLFLHINSLHLQLLATILIRPRYIRDF